MEKHYFIRDYLPADFQHINRLWEITGLGAAWRGDHQGVINRSLKMGGHFLVAENQQNEIVGTAWMTFDGRRFHLHHVGVDPAWQRQGIGRELSRLCIARAQKKGIQVKLEVHRSNQAAISLYRQLGFEYLGDYDVYIIRSYQPKPTHKS